MKLAINRINDRKFTEIGHFLTEEKLADFTQEVRRQIRVRLLVHPFVVCRNFR